MSKVDAPWKEDALSLVRALKAGGVVLTSTDTIWGLGCDATSEEAVAQMARLKGRPEEKSFLALVADEGALDRLLPELPDAAWELIEASDRPVTVVGLAGARHGLASSMIRPDGTLGVRLVKDDYLAFILKGLGRPMASSSANRSGTSFNGRFEDIDSEIIDGVSAKGAHRMRAEVGPPSWVVKFDESGRFQVLRS